MTRPILLAVVATAAAVLPAHAQVFLSHSSRSGGGTWMVDVSGQMAQPVGPFRSNINRGWGAAVSARYHFPRLSALGMRADLGILNYGNERKRVPLSPSLNRVIVDMNTSNNIALFTVGPEIMLMRGPVRPYAYGFAGYSHFYTESSAGDQDTDYDFASSVNFSDGGWTRGLGAGVRIPFSARRTSAAIDAGARWTRNGTRSYLRPGDVIDQPDGSLQFNERRTAADFWQYHLGVSFTPSRGR